MNEHECKMNEHECKMNEHECKMNEQERARYFVEKSPCHMDEDRHVLREGNFPTSATTEAASPKKRQRLAPESLFMPEFRRSRTATRPDYLMMVG
jgi:hypothetical protein